GQVAGPLRAFEHLPGEVDWVALREVVPAATATARTTEEHGGRDITVVTVLPGLSAAMHTSGGRILVALQTPSNTPDPSRDVATAILAAQEAEPGTVLSHVDLNEQGPRLQDILDTSVDF